MGEVYRATGLKLSQQAALKFLSPTAKRDERRLTGTGDAVFGI